MQNLTPDLTNGRVASQLPFGEGPEQERGVNSRDMEKKNIEKQRREERGKQVRGEQARREGRNGGAAEGNKEVRKRDNI